METKAIIVDDEERGIVALQQLLDKYCTDIAITGTATNITDAEKLITGTKPDVVFLDIEMPEGNGFRLLERFEDIDFEVVFITAYEEYAIKAIKFSALDYLLKPVKISDLQETVSRIKEKQIGRDNTKYRFLKDNLTQTNPFNKIILPAMEGYYLIKMEDIIYCKADDSYTHFYLQDKKHHVVSKQLKDYEEMLEPYNFFRIHKSFLVNLNQVNKINKADGVTVVMMNGDEIPVSFRKKEEFFDKLKSL